jgi:putative oxidoreductase
MKLTLEKQNVLPMRKGTITLIGRSESSSMMQDAGLLLLRLVVGGLLAGHGSQKLFGWFEGPGMKGTRGMVESMGFTPGAPWAAAASASEFGGGVLTTTGFLHPLGPLGTIGAMLIAALKVHGGKPIWAAKGGAELPVINIATALALTMTGPGRFSLDNLFGIRLPRAFVTAVAVIEAALIVMGLIRSATPAEEETEERPATTTSVSESKAGV